MWMECAMPKANCGARHSFIPQLGLVEFDFVCHDDDDDDDDDHVV
jgi:hypothetical protein